MSQYKDMYLDQVIELAADELVDQLGESTTQQLYEQMKRNYNITSASESTDAAE
jgi:flagellar protein FlgJ